MTRPPEPHDPKRFATLQARAALSGITLHRIEGDLSPVVYIATKWALTRELRDLDAVKKWLDRVTGHPAGAQSV